jgi:hypothetical protein
MNREELKPIELECNMGTDVNGVVQREPWKAYDIDEVNLLLDEKDAEIESLKSKLESVQASAYADSVDAGMLERRLRRALWIARAMRGRDNSILLPSRYMRKVWDNVESKCRAMAEKFK